MRPPASIPLRGALARRVCLPGLRQWQSVGAANQGLDLGVRRLRQTDLGDRRNHHAPLQAAADHLVLGGLSDGHPLQRHLGSATATPARLGLLPDGLAALRQAAPQHGRARPQPARRPGRGRRNRNPLPQQKRSAHRRRRAQPSGQDAGRRRRRGRGRRAWPRPHPPQPSAPITRPPACTPSSPPTSPPAPPPRPMDGPPIPAPPASTTIPMSSARWPPISSCPGCTGSSPTSRSGPWASTTGLRRKHLQSYLDEFVFRFNRRRTRHAAFRSLLGIAAGHPPLSLQHVDLTGSKGIRLCRQTG